MNYLQVNNPKDNSPLLCYSPETRYICEENLILLIHWRKHGNGNSKFSGITYPKLKTRNLQMTTNYIYMEKKSKRTNDADFGLNYVLIAN